MAKGVNIGESLEGLKGDGHGRHVSPRPPRRDPALGIVHGFKITRGGGVSITESFRSKETKLKRPSSMTNDGDQLIGTAIRGFSGAPIGKPSVGAQSGRHQAQHFQLKKRFFAEIEVPLDQLVGQ